MPIDSDCCGLDAGPEREHAVHDTYSPRADLPRANPVGLAAAGDYGVVLHQPALEQRAGCCARRATDQSRLRDRDSASLPQQEFSVEWSGWLRTDRDGQYTFSTRTDDGSTIEIDGHVVVDNGGVHPATRRTATIAMTPGLHQIRLRFLQATGVYEFYASWTPPGDKNESALPTQQLFVHKPPAVIVFLTRRVSSLWVLCWFALALVIAARIAKSAREIASADLRRFALRLTLALGIDHRDVTRRGGDRSARALPPRGSAAPRGAAAEFSCSGAVLDARSDSRRHCSAEPARGHRLRTEAERSWTIHGPASPHQLSGASRLRVQPSQRTRHISDRWSR